MYLEKNKKIYFAADFHLGLPNALKSIEREKKICSWLESIRTDAQKIYLLGDIFDVWFEYKHVVPKGYTRFLGKLAELTDSGISIEIFTGNHDLWMNTYFEEELNIKTNFEQIQFECNSKRFLIGHGDGIGPGDHGYKFMKKIFTHKFAQALYKSIHPSIGIQLATYFSRKGPKHWEAGEEPFLGEDKEWQILYCKEILKKQHIDYFIFGHRHLVNKIALNSSSWYINVGDWLRYNSYAVFDGKETSINFFNTI